MVGFSPEYKAGIPRRQKSERTPRTPSLEMPLDAAECVFTVPGPYNGLKDQHVTKGLVSKFPWTDGTEQATGSRAVAGL